MSAASSASCRLAAFSFFLVMLGAAGSRPRHIDNHAELDQDAHVRMDPSQSVTMLGRHNFNSTVKQDFVDHWFVLFCVDWLEPCQGIWHDYRHTAMYWEHNMAANASSWQNSAVRFAEVDCATDKALCNENDVEGYPSVSHFKDGKFLKAWSISPSAKSLSKDIAQWIGKELAFNATGALMRKETSGTSLNVAANVYEFFALLSWKDPTTAFAGYGLIAIAVFVVAWVLGTGLELEVKSAVVRKSWSSAFLPEMKEMGAPKTIVRSSIVL